LVSAATVFVRTPFPAEYIFNVAVCTVAPGLEIIVFPPIPVTEFG